MGRHRDITDGEPDTPALTVASVSLSLKLLKFSEKSADSPTVAWKLASSTLTLQVNRH